MQGVGARLVYAVALEDARTAGTVAETKGSTREGEYGMVGGRQFIVMLDRRYLLSGVRQCRECKRSIEGGDGDAFTLGSLQLHV